MTAPESSGHGGPPPLTNGAPVNHRNATAHHTDAMDAFLNGDLLNPAPTHYAPVRTHTTQDGTQYWAECQGCDWTTVKHADRAQVDALTADHYRNPAACDAHPGADEHRLHLHRTEATTPRGSCSTCSGGGCPDCTDLDTH